MIESNIIFNTNKDALLHLYAQEGHFKNIVDGFSPLITSSSVAYSAIRRDGKYFMLSNTPDISSEIYKTVFNVPDHIKNCLQNANGKGVHESSWNMSEHDATTKIFKVNKIQSAYTLYWKKDEDTIESISIASPLDGYHLANFSMNQKDQLKDFFLHVKEKCGDIIDSNDEQKYAHFLKKEIDFGPNPDELAAKVDHFKSQIQSSL